MATITFAQLKMDGLQKADDLAGIREDFRSAREFAERLRAVLEPENFDGCLVDALTVAALVRYTRAFGLARGKFLRDLVQDLDPEARRAHDLFSDWRSKHVAHSVNDFELNTVVAQCRIDDSGGRSIQAVSVQSERLVAFSEADLQAFVDLIDHFDKLVQASLEEEQKRLLKLVLESPEAEVLGEHVLPSRTGRASIKRSRPRER